MKNQETKITVGQIEQFIFVIRGKRVMLDRDLAILYGVETRVLNQAVRRNSDRFPEDFILTFQREEIRDISQIVTCSKLKHARNVFAFTEQGVAMLSGVLNSPRAVRVNIEIMRAFVRLRETLSLHKDLAAKLAELEETLENHDESIRTLFEAMRQLMAPPDADSKELGFHVKETGVGYRVN